LATSPLILDPASVGVLRTGLGERVVVNHLVQYRLETLVRSGTVDCVIIDTEDGFSQLGMMRHYLAAELGLMERDLVKHALNGFPQALERNIASLADWNRARTPEVTLVAIPSERPGSHLKGLILAPYDGSVCYKRFSTIDYWKPHRDFFYNVTYEAIAHAYRNWGARRIGISHFSRGKYKDPVVYYSDITTCQVEAMLHFCADHDGMESFSFLDDYPGNEPLGTLREFSQLPDAGVHRPITTKLLRFWGIDFVDLEWPKTRLTR